MARGNMVTIEKTHPAPDGRGFEMSSDAVPLGVAKYINTLINFSLLFFQHSSYLDAFGSIVPRCGGSPS